MGVILTVATVAAIRGGLTSRHALTAIRLAQVVERLRDLKVGLGGVLVFVGITMLISEYVHISIGHSLAVVMGLLSLALVASLLRPAPKSK